MTAVAEDDRRRQDRRELPRGGRRVEDKGKTTPKFSCLKCGCPESHVYDSRSFWQMGIYDEEGVRRWRKCLRCGHKFTSTERIDEEAA